MGMEEAKRPGRAELTCGYVRGVAEALGRDWAVVVADAGEHWQFTAWGRSAAGQAEASRVVGHVAEALHGGNGEVAGGLARLAAREQSRADRLEQALRELLDECEEARDWNAPRARRARDSARAALEA